MLTLGILIEQTREVDPAVDETLTLLLLNLHLVLLHFLVNSAETIFLLLALLFICVSNTLISSLILFFYGLDVTAHPNLTTFGYHTT
jgi:hypothetical protein